VDVSRNMFRKTYLHASHAGLGWIFYAPSPDS
jgi:hypothetical protein